MQGRRTNRVCGGAALCAGALLGGVLYPASLLAVPTITVTSEGTPQDNLDDAASGYTAYLLTATADPGQVLGGFDIGQNTESLHGIFGAMLQNWQPGDNGPASPTPFSLSQNGQRLGLDSHLLISPSVSTVIGSPREDSNGTNPLGATTNDTTATYGTGTYLREVFGINGANQANSLPLAYVVCPNAVTPTYRIAVSEAVPGNKFTGFELVSNTAPPAVPHHIVALTNSQGPPDSYGTIVTNGTGPSTATFTSVDGGGLLKVLGKNGGYVPVFANNIDTGAGQSGGYFQIEGFNPVSDSEVYALNVNVGGANPTPAQVAQLVSDINGDNIGVTASILAGGPYASSFPGYDIALSSNLASYSTVEYLGFDFTQDTNVPGVVLTDLGVVPESASADVVLTLATAACAASATRRRRDRR
jgi:hypothetical protein